MIDFSKNVDLNILFNRQLNEITHNKYANDFYDYMELNSLDRKVEALKIADMYFKRNDFNSIGGQKNYEIFLDYIAKRLDKSIPISCFMLANKSLSERYNTLLTRRIFITRGKDAFPVTENLVYQYEQNFDKDKEYIEKTKVTARQLEYMQKICEEQGFYIINQEYMTKEIANKIISYLKGTVDFEPRLFGFFIITV